LAGNLDTSKVAVVLGGYGLIGTACSKALLLNGFSVVGVGRSISLGIASNPDIRWLAQDLSVPFSEDLKTVLVSADVIVNASGALQTGLRDDLDGVHVRSIAELIDAVSETKVRIVQVSAAGVSETATTEFMRSKYRGDTLLASSQLDWVILRPTLVIGAHAYGGTALLRSVAAFPIVGLFFLREAKIQTVYLEDVAKAVVAVSRGDIASRTIAELTEHDERTLAQTIVKLRQWQGFAPWATTIALPNLAAAIVARGADLLGWLGWRSPLRTTALEALKEGVTGNPETWEAAGGFRCRSLEETLRAIPATVQERWFARLYMILPMVIAILSVFWVVSGVIGLVNYDDAVEVLTSRGSGEGFASGAVLVGAGIDLMLGLAILVRPWVRPACLGMIAVSLAYLIGATLWSGDLWLDPLGPIVKVIPATVLPLLVLGVFEKR